MDSGDGEEVIIEELVSNLSTYKDQLQQVRILLNDGPENTEYLDMEKGLEEVIALAEELLETAKPSEGSSQPGVSTSNEASLSVDFPEISFHVESNTTDDYGEKFPVGTKVQAVWSEDGEWYEGTIEALTSNGYLVRYDGWGNREEVYPDNVRPVQEGSAEPLLEAEKIAVATKEALKRKIAQAAVKDFESWTVPEKLQVPPNDPEDVKAAKRKKLHAFKSKMRMEAKEATQNKRQNAWQQFQTTKGRAKKVGFFSGRKRDSIFKSPEDPFGKVGVTGSGKGLQNSRNEKSIYISKAQIWRVQMNKIERSFQVVFLPC